MIENVTFNGNETYQLTQPNSPGSYSLSFPASSYAGRADGNYEGDGPSRYLPQMVYFLPNEGHLVLPQLEEVRKTARTAVVTGNVTDHVRLADVRLTSPIGAGGADHRGLQLFGARSGLANISATGTATFVGEMFADAFLWGKNRDCVGDVVISVDYARRTVTGQITISQCLSYGQSPGPLMVEFSADIVGQDIISRRLTVRGENVIVAGTLSGSFYGPSADEIGLVFSAYGAAGNFMAGLVAGKE